VSAAADQAIQAAKPARDTAALYVFSPDVDPTSPAFSTPLAAEGKPETMVAAINRTLKTEMARDPRIVVFGEDVADASRESTLESVPGKGGVFKVTHGLQRAFGSTRVFNSPLAEANIIGRAVGMACAHQAGRRDPVLRLHLARDDAAARRDVDDALPLEQRVLLPDGRADRDRRALRGGAPYHSQSGESIFAHCPASASCSLERAGRGRPPADRDPVRRSVLFLEHKHLYRQTNKERPGRRLHGAVRQAAVRREGTDVVVLTWGALVQRSLLAAQQAEKDGISVMVVDMRTIMPFDWNAIVAAVRHTNRVIVAHEDQLTCGFGAELAARIADELFEYLDAPVRRVAALDTPVAYYPDLEEVILPQSADVLKAIQAIARY
jgi:2-oxoisovalerate dehydrogenase E1 component